MCGRYTLTYTWQEFHDDLDAYINLGQIPVTDVVEKAPPRFNIAPTQPILVIHDERGEIKTTMMRWGLVPTWVKDPRDFPLIINARSETIMEKPAFRGGLQHHRCLVPAAGYYEWRKSPEGRKCPFYITRQDKEPMLFAGVYSNWMGATGEEVDTAAIITVPANANLKHVHARMPVILEKEQVSDWLDVRNFPAKRAYEMLRPADENCVVLHQVSTRVNSVRNDDRTLVDPFSDDGIETSGEKRKQLNLF